MTKRISKTEALGLLVRAVAEKGENHVDQGEHVYFKHGRPSCGVGLALSYAGLKSEHVDGRNGSSVPNMAKLLTLSRSPIVLDPDAIPVLEKFRDVQDGNKPWGEALQAAARV